MPKLISSRSNLLFKKVRRLRLRKGREDSGLFLVEGIHHIGELVEAGWEIETLVYAPDLLTSDFALNLVARQSKRGVHCEALTSALFTDLVLKDNPQGILVVAYQNHLTLANLTPKAFFWGAAVVSPQDPGNVGTILRTIDAVGADGLFLLDGGVELYHPSAVRASMGALFWKPVVQAPFDEFVKWVRKQSYQLVGSSAHAETDFRDFKRGSHPTILVLGNEQKGLTTEQIAACDLTISLPMYGRASSLNLAVAAGVLLFAMAN